METRSLRVLGGGGTRVFGARGCRGKVGARSRVWRGEGMNTVLLIARLLLAGTFLLAGVTKLADLGGTRAAVLGFGVPERFASPLTALVPLAELAAAVLLIASATAAAGGGLALVLLIAFGAAIARSMARGEAPECHCFGQLHSAPGGPRTLVRNAGLAAVAVAVIVGGAGTSATSWISHLSGSGLVALVGGVVLTGAIGIAGAVVLSLLRRHGELLLRIDALEEAVATHGIRVRPVNAPGLVVGTSAPTFELPDLDGAPVTLADLLSNSTPLLVLFTDPGCGPCSALMPQIAVWQREHAAVLRVVLVSRGERGGNLAHAREHGVRNVLLQRDRELIDLYKVPGTPGAVLISPNGTVASPVHTGAESVTELVRSVVAPAQLPIHRAGAGAPRLGRAAPDTALVTLDGESTTLSSQLDGPTLLLFWNPACGFCQRMLPDVKRLEEMARAPRLLLISTGDPQSNRALGLKAPIVLDPSFAAGSSIGASGTPSAVLLDEQGRIASEVAVGAAAVLALAGASEALR